jgi:hypothetical protein
MTKQGLLDVILNETISKMELGNVTADADGEKALEEIKSLRSKYGKKKS